MKNNGMDLTCIINSNQYFEGILHEEVFMEDSISIKDLTLELRLICNELLLEEYINEITKGK